MTTQPRPDAIAGPRSSDPDATKHAVRWVLAAQRSLGGQILLYLPQKRSLEYEPLLEQLGREHAVTVASWKTLSSAGWSGGPVLAAWPDPEHLGRIDGDRRTTSLCVLAWSSDNLTAWLRARKPKQLGLTDFPGPRDSPLDPVVQAGLRQLGRMVNHANNLAGVLDKRDALAVLTELHRGQHSLPAEDVYAFVLADGWPDRGAQRLRRWAAEIEAGKRKRIDGTWPLLPDALDRWRVEAAD